MMSYLASRTKAAFTALTPPERARIFLASLKRDEDIDELLHWTLPPEDTRQFAALVGLISDAAGELGWFIRHQDALLGTVELLTTFIQELEDAASVIAGASERPDLDGSEPVDAIDSMAANVGWLSGDNEQRHAHLAIFLRWTGKERVTALRQQARGALAARTADYLVVLGAARELSTCFEGELPLFLEEEELLADIGERLSRLAGVLGPIAEPDQREGVSRFVQALKGQAGLL